MNEISDNPDQPTVEHFQMLRRQWASKAQLLMATLDELPDADTAAVQGNITYNTLEYNQSVSALDKRTSRFSLVKCQMRNF